MKLKGKVNIEKVDVMMYQGIAALATDKIKKLDEELIPSFIIDESLLYFCELEKYEICSKIQSFFKLHTGYVVASSRAEWYGFGINKKQNIKK